MDSNFKDASERNRFELLVNGETAVVDYELLDNQRIALNHTDVPKALSGQGVGSRLAKETFDAVRQSGRRALVRCDFLAAWVARHPDYRDLLDS